MPQALDMMTLPAVFPGGTTWDGGSAPEQYLLDICMNLSTRARHLDSGVVLLCDCLMEGNEYQGLLVCAGWHILPPGKSCHRTPRPCP